MKTERDLIEGLKKGSVEDFHEIYSIYNRRLFYFCFNYIKVEEDAEDIVQDVFIRLWEYRSNLRTDIPISSLLYIMSRNRIISSFRSLVQSERYMDYLAYKQSLPAGDPCRKIQYKDYLDLVRTKMGKLPVSQKRIFILSRFDGLTNQEIADALQLSVQTVKNQLSLATKKLKELMGYEGI